MRKNEELIVLPKNVLLTAETLEDIEDWLLSRNKKFIEELRRIRLEEDLKGKGEELEKICKKWNIKL
ncbi:MAG TPA: hypothetical protein PKV21_04070 [bacterium]|nr:hypothetical protein [bacterium]HOM26665.1 hypothetical protein [bacterium]